MDIIVKGRNVEVPEHYRVHVAEKLERLERYDKKFIRCDVELTHEPNRRQAKNCQRVQITAKGKGPVVRAEACAGDFYAALDASLNKLEARLRKAADRRKVHRGRRTPPSVATATAGGMPTIVPDVATLDGSAGRLATAVLDAPDAEDTAAAETGGDAADTGSDGIPWPRRDLDRGDTSGDDGGEDGDPYASITYDHYDTDDGLPGRIVREKVHSAEPMSVDRALYEMELVGHDFYLFSDADTGRPSVVYRRRGFDYGVIRLG